MEIVAFTKIRAGRDAVPNRARASASLCSAIGRRTRALLAVGAVVALAAIAVPTASAGATGCTWYGHGIKYGVSNGSFCGGVAGAGTYVKSVSGNFGQTIAGLDVVCQPSLKVDFYDSQGKWYAWRQSSQMNGCFWTAFNALPTIPVWSPMQAGYARISLMSYGWSVASINLGIH